MSKIPYIYCDTIITDNAYSCCTSCHDDFNEGYVDNMCYLDIPQEFEPCLSDVCCRVAVWFDSLSLSDKKIRVAAAIDKYEKKI